MDMDILWEYKMKINKGKRLTKLQIKQLIYLIRNNCSIYLIADYFGLARQSISRYVKKTKRKTIEEVLADTDWSEYEEAQIDPKIEEEMDLFRQGLIFKKRKE